MADPIRLPGNLGELLDDLDDVELGELVRIALRSGEPEAAAIVLRALRRVENAPPPHDPAQLNLPGLSAVH